VLPGVRSVDAGTLEEVPLQCLPALGGAGVAAVHRDELGEVGDLVGRGGGDLRPRAQLPHRVFHALAVADLEHARAGRECASLPDPRAALDRLQILRVGVVVEADDDLPGDVVGGVRDGGRREECGGGDDSGEEAGQRRHGA
jgi:hypothetical protein